MRALHALTAIGVAALVSTGCTRSMLVKLNEPKLKAGYAELSDAFAEAGWACEDKTDNTGRWLQCKNGSDILMFGLDMVDGRGTLTMVSPWQQPRCKDVANFREVVDKFNRDNPIASCECVGEHVLFIWTSMFLPEDGLPRTELPALARKWHKVTTGAAARAHLLDD